MHSLGPEARSHTVYSWESAKVSSLSHARIIFPFSRFLRQKIGGFFISFPPSVFPVPVKAATSRGVRPHGVVAPLVRPLYHFLAVKTVTPLLQRIIRLQEEQGKKQENRRDVPYSHGDQAVTEGARGKGSSRCASVGAVLGLLLGLDRGFRSRI